jgi:L,D-transpeptidase ErfK/SrfK
VTRVERMAGCLRATALDAKRMIAGAGAKVAKAGRCTFRKWLEFGEKILDLRLFRLMRVRAVRGPARGAPGSPVRLPRAWWPWVAVPCLVVLIAGNSGYVYGPLDSGREGSEALAARSRRGSDQPIQMAAERQQLRTLQAERKRLLAAIQSREPRGQYIVIDQTQNRMYLRRRGETLHEAICSGGSGIVLREAGGGKRVWVFDTPRGMFRVSYKVKNPVWRKPDWAFIEQGLPVPENQAERFEYGSLGEYALCFGDGYMIHGTLYERLLGRSVTHGCIRLGQTDLRKIYSECPVGTPIYIY